MIQYSYKARDKQGNLYESIISAENEDAALSYLTEKGLWIVHIKKAKNKDKSILNLELDKLIIKLTGVGLNDIVVFCRQFAALVNSGIPILRSLNILSSQTENQGFAEILKKIKDDVEQGISLSEAFGKHPKIFDRLFISMIKAGESGGVLDEVLNRISGFMEYKAKLSGKIKSAMAYPVIVSIFAVIIFFIMLTFVLPRFSSIFTRLGSELPAYTQFLINISEFIRSSSFVVFLIAIAAIIFGLLRIYSTSAGKYFFDGIFLKIPILGGLLQKISISRFTRTFGTLIKSGVPILTALEIVEDSAGNAVIAKSVRHVKNEIKQGGMIYKPLEDSPVFPPMVVSMIAVGEETGELDVMLTKIADFYDTEVEVGVEALTSMLEPFMMVFLGGMVGAVIVGMYLPMFKIFEALN
ncbi:MAG TPA: type II secretion system F family protein [Candidatus Gastranaerophilales bacterium]|nr:type II secretion system F family protein [Candidatus Gastranaerophilales bacterium]